MQWEFPHRIEYEADAQSIDDVIATLVAQKRLIEEGASVVCALSGIDLERVDIRVSKVVSGSLTNEFWVQLYGSYQAELEEKIIGGYEHMLGVDIPEGWEPIVTLGSLAVTYWVAKFAYDSVRNRKKDRPASTHIEGDYNVVINTIASKMHISPEKVEGVLEGQLPSSKRRALIRSVTNFLNPARRESGTKIKVDGAEDIGPQTIREYPSDAELAEIDDRKNLDLPGAIIEIRATDKDRSKTGWAAKIVGDRRFKRRMSMDLYPTIDAEKLAKLDKVRGDLILEGDKQDDGSFKAKRIHLLNFEELGDDDTKGSSKKG
jgi:hypothetical protein